MATISKVRLCMPLEHISLIHARQLALKAQNFDHYPLGNGKESVSRLIDQLGYIQIDTIAAIQRSHHHTLWIRMDGYDVNYLHELQAKDRSIFEYWTHAMSYVNMTDYRYFKSRMDHFRDPKHPWIRKRLQECGHLFNPIMQQIRENGPMGISDFKHVSPQPSGTWWSWKPVKIALEILFWRGELMVAERKNFQKRYDLSERILPKHLDISLANDDEVARYLVRRALNALGIARAKEINQFMQPGAERDIDFRAVSAELIYDTIQDLISTGEIQQVKVEDLHHNYYLFQNKLEEVDLEDIPTSRVYLLSPFDNLIIQRERIKTLFHFDYKLECYLPAKKRKYGYFVLPILWKGQFIGRCDPKADRKTKMLNINYLMF
ncbi:MAG: winged helix-turn-helix domain-containing protein, partial [Caldithrix sp.]|nr:winged helix-turn-helix domain-containing protein [Caldithrix sp.]